MELGKAEEIAEELRTQIIQGDLYAGTKIASERDLSKEFGASRMTARRAIQILEGEGLVTRYPVRGTFVANVREKSIVDQGRVIAMELRNSGSFLRQMEILGRKPRVQFLEQPSLVVADTDTAKHLQLQAGILVLKRYRLQFANNTPYRLIESYYPADLFEELLTTDIGSQPLFAWLQKRHGLKVVHAQEDLIARLATAHERQLLRISLNAPVAAFNRTVWTDTKRPVEWAHIIGVASLYRFIYQYDIPNLNLEKEVEGEQITQPIDSE